MSTAEDEVRELLEQQPDDGSSEEIVREPALQLVIQRGIVDSDHGRTISNEEMARQIESAPRGHLAQRR